MSSGGVSVRVTKGPGYCLWLPFMVFERRRNLFAKGCVTLVAELTGLDCVILGSSYVSVPVMHLTLITRTRNYAWADGGK